MMDRIRRWAESMAPVAGEGDIWFWWLSPLILSVAMLASARFLIGEAGMRIRPKRLDLL